MAYKLAQVFSTDGTELTNSLHTTTLSGANQMAYDGRYLWVTCGTNGIAIFDHWADDINRVSTRPAFTDIDDLTQQYWADQDSLIAAIPQMKLKLVTYITVTSSQILRSTCLEPQAESLSTKTARDSYSDNIFSKVTSRSGNALNAAYIKLMNGKMYVTNGIVFDEIFEFDINTQKFTQRFSVPDTYKGSTTIPLVAGMPVFTNGQKYKMLSNLEVADNKLWMVGQSWGEDKQRQVYNFNPITGNLFSVDSQARPGFSRSFIANGMNGYVYVANYNDWGVCKFDASTSAFVKNIRVNGYPCGIWAGSDRRIWVTSYAGMLSLLDYDDDQVHNDYSTESIASAVQVDPTDGTSIWFINATNVLAKYSLNTKTQMESSTSHTHDWEFYNDKLTTPDNFIIIPGFTYSDSNLNTVTVKPHIIVINDSSLVCWFISGTYSGSPDENNPLADIVYRDYKYPYTDYPSRTIYAELTGQAAVSAGNSTYFGE